MNEKNPNTQKHMPTVSERAQAAKNLINNVLASSSTVLQPERYTMFLNTIERFHWYSYINNLLILSQYPQAQYLAGYDVWKRTSLSTYNDPSRRILSSTEVGKGIKLIAPFTVVNNTSRSLINFVVPVYDVNQVNDLPLPENDFLDLKKCTYMDIVNAISFVAPYRTAFASDEDPNLSHSVKGYCNHSAKNFVVDSHLHVRGLLSVLLHEFVVAELYLTGYDNEKLQELIVESVFYILIKHFNLNADGITFSFVSKFKNTDSETISQAFSLIQKLSHSIIEKIEEHLEYIIDLVPATEDYAVQASFFDDIEFKQ